MIGDIYENKKLLVILWLMCLLDMGIIVLNFWLFIYEINFDFIFCIRF